MGTRAVNGEVWPNLFLVGPGKSGTTSLYSLLRAVPGIYFPSLKEPGYFSHGLEAHRMLHAPRGGGVR